jgi:hypothetical protein
MLRIEDEANDEGWVETADLAGALGFADDLLPIAQRLSWMKRYGMLEYDDRLHLWRLTDGGQRVTRAKLAAAQSRSIESLDDELFVEVMAKVGQRYVHGSPMLATMLRREFLYGTRPR